MKLVKVIFTICFIILGLSFYAQPTFSALAGKDQQLITVKSSQVTVKSGNELLIQVNDNTRIYKVSPKIIKDVQKKITSCKDNIILIINKNEIKSMKCMDRKNQSF